MKVAELSGAELDYWVAKAKGEEAALLNNGRGGQCVIKTCGAYEPYSPSRAWSQGGLIIEREGIGVGPDYYEGWKAWKESSDNNPRVYTGKTALEAVMRRYVASKFGTEVPDAE